MAYEPRMAAALSGATLAQLAYWRKPQQGKNAILRPEISARRPIAYSFRDIVAQRTFVYLREARPLQRIRKALNTLSELGETQHLSEYKLVANAREALRLFTMRTRN